MNGKLLVQNQSHHGNLSRRKANRLNPFQQTMLQNLLGQEMVSRASRLLNQLLILILGVLVQIHLVLLVLVVVAHRCQDLVKGVQLMFSVRRRVLRANQLLNLLDGLVFNYGKSLKGSIYHCICYIMFAPR